MCVRSGELEPSVRIALLSHLGKLCCVGSNFPSASVFQPSSVEFLEDRNDIVILQWIFHTDAAGAANKLQGAANGFFIYMRLREPDTA